MSPQLKGTEKLQGTYLFDLATSARALRLNRFLHGMVAGFRGETLEEFLKTRNVPGAR